MPWAGVSCVIQEEERGQLATNFLLPLLLQKLNQFLCLDGVAEKHNLFKSYFSPPFKLLNLNKFHRLLSRSTTLEKQMD